VLPAAPPAFRQLGNDPINRVDPTGMTAEKHHGGFSGTPQSPGEVVLVASTRLQFLATTNQPLWDSGVRANINGAIYGLSGAEKWFLVANPILGLPFWRAQQAADLYSDRHARTPN
jgi:hypothetical protein